MGKKKWTSSAILKQSKKYKTRTEFAKAESGAYEAAIKLKLLEKACKHMLPFPRWTEKTIKREARKYKTRSEFAKGSLQGYLKAIQFGILRDVCKHMPNPLKWTEDAIIKEAKKYKTRAEFAKGKRSAYAAAIRDGVLDKVCRHMKSTQKPNGYWTEERVIIESQKYICKSDFLNASSGAYRAAKALMIFDKICKHMVPKGHLYRRKLYSIEFEKIKSVYVGLSFDPEKRKKSHLCLEKKSQKYLNKYFKKYKYEFIIYNKWYSYKNIGVAEKRLIEKYKDNGWRVLNRADGGGLGSLPRRWTKEYIASAASECITKSQFRNKYTGAYSAAIREGVLDEVCAHMISIQKPSGYWTEERVVIESQKYTRRSDFAKWASGAIDAAYRMGIWSKISKHMSRYKK